MILVLAGITVFLARYAILGVTNSLQVLAEESNRIAQGQLDHALAVDGQDEIGKLRRSFEQMRRSLKARLDELRQLLHVSQGVATSLDLEESLLPVLEAAVSSGPAAATIVFNPQVFAELSQTPAGVPKRLALGPAADRYLSIDDQVLELANEQEQILLTNPARVRVLRFDNEQGRPQAMAIFAMRHENRYYGALWLAYDRLHAFSDEETRYFTTLASQAALAAANANLFLSAEVGRQRLAAILESTPDPVLVTDSQNRLLLANPAARKAFGADISLEASRDVKSLLSIERLVQLLENDAPDRQSAEITLPDGRTYLAIASSTMMNGQRGGRVCVMRDITEFKELDALKSDFVSTVSHDLRSPLTLIHGYATMLQMVGELNDQQANYASKIVSGIENMSRMVTNLLDLGRIEAGVGLKLELVPVRDVTEQAASALQHQANQRHVNVNINFPENVEPIVEADAALLQQALQNLVENAIKYTEAGGQVEIGFNLQGENVLLFVKDTGIGIAPVDQSRLFEKFYRVARRGAMQPKGTGLGLAIVKSIAERHGGRVWVESQLGKGSTFYFLIPLRQQPEKA
jgi:PAS domain S-box-containing protein